MSTHTARVGDVIRLQRRAVEVEPLTTYEEVGVRSFGRGIFHKEPISGSELGNKRVFEIHPGDLILSNVFAWEGAIALAGESERGKIGSHRFMTYVADPEIADESYLRYFFVSEPGLALIGQASPGSAGRNRTLAIDRFEALTIPLPDVAEQRRVSATLDHVADRARRLAHLVGTATTLAGAIRSCVAARPDLDDTERREHGWVRVRLGEIASVWPAEEPVDPTSSYPIAGVYSFGRGLLSRGALDGSATSYKKLARLREGNIVMSRLKAWEGAIALVSNEFDGRYVSPEFPQFEVNRSRALPQFLGFALSSPLFWQSLAGGSKGIGARRERVSAERFLAHEVWIPPLTHQRQVVQQLEQLAKVERLRKRTATLTAALESSALNQAFAGLA